MSKGFDASNKDIALLFEKEQPSEMSNGPMSTMHHTQGTINPELLLTKIGVDYLTNKFIAVFKNNLRDWKGRHESRSEVHLNALLRDMMYKASTASFLGSRILDEYPELYSDFSTSIGISLPSFSESPGSSSPVPTNPGKDFCQR